MAIVSGTVATIKVAGSLTSTPSATVVLNVQGTNTQETFFLWVHSLNEFVPLALSIVEVSSLSLLRDALVNKLLVTITTPGPTSAQIESVAI
jgi:hypothetical protein